MLPQSVIAFAEGMPASSLGPFSEGGHLNEQQIEAAHPQVTVDYSVLQPVTEAIKVKRRILLHDEDGAVHSVVYSGVADCLDEGEYELVSCRTESEAFDHLQKSRFDLFLWGLDSRFENSFREFTCVLHQVRLRESSLRVILLAPQEALACASEIKAVRAEALILKPLHASDVRSGIDRALKKNRIVEAIKASPFFQAGADKALKLDELTPLEDGKELGLIGGSLEMRRIVALIRKIGPSNANVLITGESGTGKEMVASAIHRVSDRNKKPFIAINCAAIPRDLLESELFGHARGAFTGATSARRGLFEEANEGTVLLDEIGDLPLPLQAKILRLLQTRQVKPLGQNVTKEVDVRILSATHKNLKALIQKGEFREDLYYRLNVMPLHLPALRDRKEDIVLLAEYFLHRYHERVRQGRGRSAVVGLSKKAQTKLLALPWRGNVRELENVIERAIVLADGSLINDTDIMTEEMEPAPVTTEDLFNSGLTLKDIEREYIKYVLTRTGNRKEAATRILGIDRKTLYRKEKVYGIRAHNGES
jgi:DNA-binding NtrC family response regulator